MSQLVIFDALNEGLNMSEGFSFVDGEIELELVREDFVGNGFWFTESRIIGESFADRIFVLRYDQGMLPNPFRPDDYIEQIELFRENEPTLYIRGATATQLDIIRIGVEAFFLGSDNIVGNSFDDLIYGFGGDDLLEGLDGNDTLFGGVGNDFIYGDDGDDVLIGQENNDTIEGGAGNDSIDGNSEDDLLFGDQGNDTLNGQEGSDELQGGSGEDLLIGGMDDDFLFGDQGNDTLNGQQGSDQIQGGSGNDSLIGGVGSDLLFGEEGNDTFYGSEGEDIINGGDGIDTVVFFGSSNEYVLQLSASSTRITDRFTGRDDTDNLMLVEVLNFADLDFDLQQLGGTASLSYSDFESFIELYIAYFNRSPDAIGLNFWGTAFANGTTLEQMATLFVDQDETRATYPDGTSNFDFVTAVYDNVLGRIPDEAGFDFWVDVLNNGGVSRDQFILEVLRGVQDGSSDRAFLDTKVDIGAYFAVHRGMSDVDNASAAMALFDGSQSSVNQAVAAIDGFYQDALDPTNGEFLMQVVGVLDNPFAA